MSPTTAHALVLVGFWTMFLCWGIGYGMLRLEHRSRRITDNAPRKRSESDHPKAATIVSVTLPGRVRDRDRVAFGHAHVSLASNARMMAVERICDQKAEG